MALNSINDILLDRNSGIPVNKMQILNLVQLEHKVINGKHKYKSPKGSL